MRKGSSLIEALLALVLLQFGLLALGAMTAMAARDLGTANRRARAQLVARNRVEELRSLGCGSAAAASGQLRWPGGLEEIWRVEVAGVVRVVVDSVVMQLPRGRLGYHVRRGWLLCPA